MDIVPHLLKRVDDKISNRVVFNFKNYYERLAFDLEAYENCDDCQKDPRTCKKKHTKLCDDCVTENCLKRHQWLPASILALNFVRDKVPKQQTDELRE